MAGPSALCYCHSAVPDTAMMVCGTCKKTFHPGCLKTGRPSSLEGDIFYQFTCTQCSESGQEEVDRLKLSWLQVVMLTLYNLQLSGNGKYGFFRWKEHICAFIDKHWTTFFGYSRKKTNLWYGTVAGTLSSGCPAYFLSGAQELNEPGWWRLTKMKPPSLKLDPPSRLSRRYKLESDQTIKVESLRSRRGKTSSIEAAMELKAKRATLTEAKDLRKRTTRNSRNSDSSLGSEDRSLSAESLTPPVSVTSGDKGQGDMDRKFGVVAASGSPFQLQPIKTERLEEPMETADGRSSGLGKRSSLFGRDLEDDTSSQFSHASSKTDMYLTERDLWAKGTLPEFLLKDDEDDENDSDLEIDPGTFSPPRTDSPLPMSQSPSLCDILSSIDDSSRHTSKTEMSEISGHVTVPKVKVKEEEDIETDLSSSSEDSRGATEENSTADVNDTLVQRTGEKGKGREEAPPQKKPEVRLVPMSRYEESDLLRRLNQAAEICTLEPDLARFRRKLIVRQLQREHGQKVFNLDWEVKRSLGQLEQLDSRASNHPLNPHRLPTSQSGASETRVLDRFQLGRYERRILTARPTSFLTRLVGTQDSELQPITSPYTARTLKPFIRRDYESKPLKLRLLEEIKAYPHRKQLSWETPPSYPIDYCYVRPQHIPSVNTLCAEFFWPGIDLSECLQYPDFSCVVLYRKVVIAFAFMVPDTKYNEAYISFIFSHPEWRQAGIGTFMLYHLIQTCMGKDVTLHVSATNPAMLLYQKFGFKPEEFILDFYDKYYPVDSVACKHAFLLRLRR